MLKLLHVPRLSRHLQGAWSCHQRHTNVHYSINDAVMILLKIETLDGFERFVFQCLIKEWGREATAVKVEKIYILVRVIQANSVQWVIFLNTRTVIATGAKDSLKTLWMFGPKVKRRNGSLQLISQMVLWSISRADESNFHIPLLFQVVFQVVLPVELGAGNGKFCRPPDR